MAWFRRKEPEQEFFQRFIGRTIIVHAGFPSNWLEELLKQPGGGGHFRIDVRIQTGRRPTPVEWFIHRHVLPLGLPLPLILRVEEREVRVRHLIQGQHPIHPSEVTWLLNELDYRYHVRLPRDEGLQPVKGLPPNDNEIDYDI